MLDPTPADLLAAKAEIRKRFGHDRGVRVLVANPATGEPMLTALLADLTLADAVAYHDARGESVVSARAALLAERLVWPGPAELEPLRAEWGALDTLIEREYRREVGFSERTAATCRPLTAATCPPGLSQDKAAELLRASTGRRLWSIHNHANGLSCVVRQPQPEVWLAGSRVLADAMEAKTNTLLPHLQIIADHCVWAGDGLSLAAHIEERPGRAWCLNAPWAEMGGAGAKTSAARF